MNKLFFLLLTLLVSITLTITTEADEKKSAESNPPKGSHDITIFFSNDVRGEIEPCG
ncbi:MAG: hypothetical protein OEV89_08715 [Desulfobulbaceae bacterium]|nr:hypothetical protein [Desulfobulbaceae bacterium]HIJ90775.1 hypothetical protein [Deltaproteobacteria bacterium]